jgi:3-oxoacyl-[acyl-carrier-protein] synthase-3
MNIGIVGLGAHLPERLVTNDEIEVSSGFRARRERDVSLDDWVRGHHGGLTRHAAAPGEATSDMAAVAATRAVADAGLRVGDIDLIVLSTFTSDHRVPSSAAVLQANLRSDARIVELSTACTGFLDAGEVAAGLVHACGYRTALVVCADVLTRLLDPEDWLARTVFGDGAGAAVLRRTTDGCGFQSIRCGTQGELGQYVRVAAGGSRQPITADALCARDNYLRVRFREVHQWAVPRLVGGAREALDAAGMTIDDIDWFVPHQASTTIVRETAAAMGVPDEKVVLTYPSRGNTSASSIPIALLEARDSGRLRPGQALLMSAVGAGMSWAAATYRWSG